jgi:hypothetical protein
VHQAFLTTQLAIAEWQLARYQRLEARALDQLGGASADPGDPDSAIVAKLFELNPKQALHSIQRSIDRAEKAYHRAFRELRADYLFLAQARQARERREVEAFINQAPPLIDPGAQWDEMDRKWLDGYTAQLEAARAAAAAVGGARS